MLEFSSTELVADKRLNYGGVLSIGDSTVGCYTPSQMKGIFPKGGYAVLGEHVLGSTEDTECSLRTDGVIIPVSPLDTASRLWHKPVGYIAISGTDDTFVLVLRKVLLIRFALVAAVAIAACIAAYFLWFAPGLQGDDLEIDAGAVEWTGFPAEEPGIPADGIRLPGYKSISVQADTREVSIALHNPPENDCYLVMRLVLSETGEELFESKMIEPGKGLYAVTLSRALSPGTYKAQLQYEAYDRASLSRLNGAVINLDVIAE